MFFSLSCTQECEMPLFLSLGTLLFTFWLSAKVSQGNSPQLTQLLHEPSLYRAWWGRSAILAPRRLRQEEQEFQTSLGYTVRPRLRKSKTPKPKPFQTKTKPLLCLMTNFLQFSQTSIHLYFSGV
jgi:hypothetical protein